MRPLLIGGFCRSNIVNGVGIRLSVIALYAAKLFFFYLLKHYLKFVVVDDNNNQRFEKASHFFRISHNGLFLNGIIYVFL